MLLVGIDQDQWDGLSEGMPFGMDQGEPGAAG